MLKDYTFVWSTVVTAASEEEARATAFSNLEITAAERRDGPLCLDFIRAEPRPLPDGGEVRHDAMGFYTCTAEEAAYEDAGNNSVGFDGRPHFADLEDAYDAGYGLQHAIPA